MPIDPITGEGFALIVGRRTQSPIGEPPPKGTRDALTAMAQYRTRAPKGVFRYQSHEEMNADRLRWTVEAMIENQLDEPSTKPSG